LNTSSCQKPFPAAVSCNTPTYAQKLVVVRRGRRGAEDSTISVVFNLEIIYMGDGGGRCGAKNLHQYEEAK